MERKSWNAYIVVPHTTPADDEFHFTEFTIFHRTDKECKKPTVALIFFYLSDIKLSEEDQNHWAVNLSTWTKDRRVDVLCGYLGSNGRILEEMAKHHTPLSNKPCSLHMAFECDDELRTSGDGEPTIMASKFVTAFYGTPETRVSHSTDGRHVIDAEGCKGPLPTDTQWRDAQQYSLKKMGRNCESPAIPPIAADMKSIFMDPDLLPKWDQKDSGDKSGTSRTSGTGGKQWVKIRDCQINFEKVRLGALAMALP